MVTHDGSNVCRIDFDGVRSQQAPTPLEQHHASLLRRRLNCPNSPKIPCKRGQICGGSRQPLHSGCCNFTHSRPMSVVEGSILRVQDTGLEGEQPHARSAWGAARPPIGLPKVKSASLSLDGQCLTYSAAVAGAPHACTWWCCRSCREAAAAAPAGGYEPYLNMRMAKD
jgi:hypothetical protein